MTDILKPGELADALEPLCKRVKEILRKSARPEQTLLSIDVATAMHILAASDYIRSHATQPTGEVHDLMAFLRLLAMATRIGPHDRERLEQAATLLESLSTHDARWQALEEAALVCENEPVFLDVSWLLHATKQQVGARVATELASAIRSLKHSPAKTEGQRG